MPRLRKRWEGFKTKAYDVNIATKIIVPFIALAVLLATAGGYGTAVWTTGIMDDSSRTTLKSATEAAGRTFALYENQTRIYTKALSETTGLAEALRSGKITQIRQILLPNTITFDLDFIDILNEDGVVVFDNHGPYAIGTSLDTHPMIQSAKVDIRKAELIKTGSGYALVGAAPVKDANGRAGYIVTGYNVTPAFLQKIKDVEGFDISLLAKNELLATTRKGVSNAGCTSSSCHTANIGHKISNVAPNEVAVETTNMAGKFYLIEHDVLMLAGEPAGVFTIIMPMDNTVRTQSVIRQTIFLMSSLLLVLIILLGFLIARGIANPLRLLSINAKKVARGDLTPRASYPGTKDEIGELALSFNKMTESLERYTTNLRKRLLELSVLYETGVSTRNVYDMDDLLELVVQNAAKAVNADTGSLLLAPDDNSYLEMRAAYNMPASLVGTVRVDPNGGKTTRIGKKRGEPDLSASLHQIAVAANSFSQGRSLLYTKSDHDEASTKLLTDAKCSSIISVPLKTRDGVLGIVNLGRAEAKPPFADEDRNFLVTMASQAAAYIENRKLIENLRESYIATVRALAEAIDAKDHYTRGHSTRVAKYAVAIARELKLSDEEVEGIETAAYLHDVGKIGISDQILMKPSKLSLEEMETVRNHPTIGAKILSPINFPWEIVPIVFQHHERYSGGGYPNKLAYDDIHIGARILIVADSYEAMTSERPYRAALSQPTAIEELRRGSGTQFDPMVVETFVKVLERGVENTELTHTRTD